MSHLDRARRAGPGRVGLASTEILIGVIVAHVWAGGRLPSIPYLVGLAGLVFLATHVVLHRGMAKRAIVPVLLAAQVVMHHLLMASVPDHGHAVHATSEPMMSWQMATAHAASAALTLVVWWVREKVLNHLDHLPRQPILVAASAPTPSPRWRAMLHRPHPWLTGAPRRGPPAGLSLRPA